jgi:hypothetical protein
VKKIRRLAMNAVCSIEAGSRHIGTLRKTVRSSRIGIGLEAAGFLSASWTPAVVIEDEPGHQVARVHIAGTRRKGKLVDLLVELDGAISQPLRKVALAASLITERELISFGSAGGGI